MADAARRSALDGSPERLASPDFVVTERPGLTLVHVAAKSASSALGVALPVEPNATAGNGEITIFWTGPGRWLIQSELLTANEIADCLRATLDATVMAIADLSSASVVIRVCGTRVRHTLNQYCPIDLHVRAFPPGTVVQSVLEGVSVMLHHLPDGRGVDLYVPRSYAEAIWEWLAQPLASDDSVG